MQEFIALAERLAEASGAIIMRYFRSGVAVDDKADGSPVTIADREAEAAMRALILEAFPDHGIIGEEHGITQPDAEYRWTLDPIDGTKNFVAGSFLFGTLIGLFQGDQPILGVINHPVTGHRLIGAAGEARLNGQKVGVRPCHRIEDAVLLTSDHWDAARHQNQNMDAYAALTRRAKLYRTWGDCHGYFLLATGFADIMLDPVMNIWDIAPLIPIVEGAGGRITDWHGGPAIAQPITRQTSAIATAGPLHDAVIRALNPGT
jgi:histidinol phosphatase-like enzyme (inositol monophosphatase family)